MTNNEQNNRLYENMQEIARILKERISKEAQAYFDEHAEQYQNGTAEVKNFIDARVDELKKFTKKQLKKIDSFTDEMSFYLLNNF